MINLNYSAGILIISLLFPAIASSQDYPSSNGLKKLFTTPYERQELDKRRKSGVLEEANSNIVSKVFNSSSVELRGVVYRHGKMPVVWVNDSNTLKTRDIDSNIRVYGLVKRNSEEKVQLRVNDKFIKMKPGQVWSESDREAVEKYRTKVVE